MRSAVAPALEGDDPVYLGLLLLPVVMLAGLLAAGQSLRVPTRIALPDMPSLPRLAAPAPLPAPLPPTVPVVASRSVDLAALVSAQLPRLAMPVRSPTVEPPALGGITATIVYAPVVPRSVEPIRLPRLNYGAVPPAIAAPSDVIDSRSRLAALSPVALQPALSPPANMLPVQPPAADVPADISPGITTGLCRPPVRVATLAPALSVANAAAPTAGPSPLRLSPDEFGRQLAVAAKSQIGTLTIYSARYRAIAFPGGDVPDFYGACSDVIIRAYRQLGIDLQQLVAEARIGGGDTNIAHRRTESLRQLFTREGASLPVSSFPEDYKPGDVVTYYRPFSRVSRAHIAIVSDVMGPNRRHMIIHNRGWGPQLEDALFVDRITGHYRFHGKAQPASPTLVAAARSGRSAATGLLASRGRSTF